MPQYTFPNGLTVNFAGLSPDNLEAQFQNLVMKILGLDPSRPIGDPVWKQVRVGWQIQGQPGWANGLNPDEDNVCIITAQPGEDRFTEVQDEVYAANDSKSLGYQIGYTQVWRVKLVFYGPTAFQNAALVLASQQYQWVHDTLAPNVPGTAGNLYFIPDFRRPAYVPELFMRRWWKRADLDLRFNELVILASVVPSADGQQFTLIKENGLTETFTVPSN